MGYPALSIMGYLAVDHCYVSLTKRQEKVESVAFSHKD